MGSAQKVNNPRNDIQPVTIERMLDGTWYSFKLSVPSRGECRSNHQWFKVSFSLAPLAQQTPKELTMVLLNELSALFQKKTKIKNVTRFETVETDKTLGYWLNCEVNLSGVTPDRLDEALVDHCNHWLQAVKKHMVVNRTEDHLDEGTVSAEDHNVADTVPTKDHLVEGAVPSDQ